MVDDEPQNDSGQQSEWVESIPLATLLENPDPDFDVVVEKRSNDIPGRTEYGTDGTPRRPPAPKASLGRTRA